MEKIPQQLLRQFDACLIKKEVLEQNHNFFRKWLQYYLDFCFKYGHDPKNSESLRQFINKLREKKQSKSQQKQAYDAILMYYEIFGIHPDGSQQPAPEMAAEKEAMAVREEIEPYDKNDAVLDNNWKSVYTRLRDEIKVRHYSPKTYKAYSTWVYKFQRFVNKKEFEQLSSEDVKQFLTYLAVEQNVSASSQNQAFNALLFFFRNILKKEFGKIDGVVRAKRRPYIPVVLSREEVDLIILKLRYPYDLIVKLLYGCGLRLFECMSAMSKKQSNPLSTGCSLPNVQPPIPFATALQAICSRPIMISGPSRSFLDTAMSEPL